MQKYPSEILEITSNKPGPTVAIFTGVHGNERAGVYALNRLASKLKITRGKAFLVYANPPAIEADVRMVNKNLNRCFYKGNNGNTAEDKRARYLMKVLDKSDALLDLHMFYDDQGEPFVICEENALDLAQKFDVNIISTNWTKTEPGGTDGYMYLQNKIGVCVECGPISKSKEYVEFAINTIYQFLKYFEMTNEDVNFSRTNKRIIRAERAIYKTSSSFKLNDNFHNFMRLREGQIIARDKVKTWKARSNECIIFPHYKARINEEAYIIGTEQV